MKKMKNYLLALLVVAGFIACSDDDPGMAPVIGGEENVTLELHRDTIDKYTISLPIVSEEGVASVTLTDKSTNKVLNEQTSFSNPNDFIYTYELDLTVYTGNTQLQLELAITDNANQVIKQNIVLNIKKLSEMEVRFSLENIIVYNESASLCLTVMCGITPLDRLDVYVGSNTTPSSTYVLLSDEKQQDKFDLNVKVDGLQDGENTVRVVVFDEKGKQYPDASVTVVKKTPKVVKDIETVKLNSNTLSVNTWSIGETYDDSVVELPWGGEGEINDKLYRIEASMEGMESALYEYYDFRYNDNGTVKTITYSKWEYGVNLDTYEEFVKEFEDARCEYEYTYDENGQVTGVTRDGSTYVTDIVYESGSIKSYVIDEEVYEALYADKNGESIRIDLLDKDLSRKTMDFGEKVPNPLYVEGVPVLIPLSFSFGFEFSQYIYNPYFFESVKDGDSVVTSYVVESGHNAEYDQDYLSVKNSADAEEEYIYWFINSNVEE